MEQMLTAAFWASLLPEEGHSTRITLAYLAPQSPEEALLFAAPLPLTPATLAHLAPSVERAGIHLGVWQDDGELRVWGLARALPIWCVIVEVAAPGLLIVKGTRPDQVAKFPNIMVLEGATLRLIEPQSAVITDAPPAMQQLLAFYASAGRTASDDVLVRLALSMRQHGRGGTLLVVPAGSSDWRSSIAPPLPYSAGEPYSGLSKLIHERSSDNANRAELSAAIHAVAGLTAVDGAAVMSDSFAVLAYGVKIRPADGGQQLERVLITEPIEGNEPVELDPSQLGGTRHLSAAQFVQDRPDSIAMVASQDGRFTVFVWSRAIGIVHGHRLDALLL